MSVLDTSIVAEVRETLGDDIYRDFIVRMLEEARQVDGRLQTLLAEDNRAEIATVAHRMAGSAVSVGTAALHARLKAIEDAVRLDAPNALPGLIGALSDDICRTKAALEDILR